jgi:hypothetical protein
VKKNKGEPLGPPSFLFEPWRSARVGSHRCPVLRPGYRKGSIPDQKTEKPFDFCDGVDLPPDGERIPAAPCQLDVSPGAGRHGQAYS